MIWNCFKNAQPLQHVICFAEPFLPNRKTTNGFELLQRKMKLAIFDNAIWLCWRNSESKATKFQLAHQSHGVLHLSEYSQREKTIHCKTYNNQMSKIIKLWHWIIRVHTHFFHSGAKGAVKERLQSYPIQHDPAETWKTTRTPREPGPDMPSRLRSGREHRTQMVVVEVRRRDGGGGGERMEEAEEGEEEARERELT